jgi:hypothetical protein
VPAQRLEVRIEDTVSDFPDEEVVFSIDGLPVAVR